jgi:alpha-glucosidase
MSPRDVALVLLLAGGLACRTEPTVPPPAAASTVEPAAPAPAAPGPGPDDLAPLVRRGEAVDVLAPGAHLRVTFPAPGVVRMRLWPLGAEVPDASFAVNPRAGIAPQAIDEVEEGGEDAIVRAGGAELRVNRRTLAFALRDGRGQVVAEAPGPASWKGEGQGGRIALALAPGEHAYGLGDKVLGMDRRGKAFDLWNYDAFGWRGSTDPLYKSIPFLVLLGEGKARGVFVDSAARAHVDVGAKAPGRLEWEVDRGALDLYFLAGPDPRTVISEYTGLTGRTPLPPRWALGYHQSRYSYGSEIEVRSLVELFRKRRFPLDAIWLDIDFQEGLAPFRVNHRSFPHFERMVRDLLRQGVRTVVITDPHIQAKPGTEPYDAGVRGDHFILDPAAAGEGGTPRPFIGKVWPGDSAFPEFTLSRTRAWWGGLYRAYVEAGVAGFWDDMNEPALFNVRKSMADGVIHRLEGGGTADHVAVHNVYGLLQARATHEGVLALRAGARPFVLTRAGAAGSQRWAATWTGDNRADREGLALTVPTLLGLGASGWAFAGADVGGFEGCPDPRLLTEWMELGALQPFFRNHSNKGSCRREPWVDGKEELRRRRAAVERRQRLLPYLYTLFEEASRTGLPVMRPLWLEHPEDPSTVDNDRAFLLGRDLLVAPKLVEGDAPYPVTLPAGEWFDVATGERRPGGRIEVRAPPEDSLRVYARAGAIVPEGPAARRASDAPRGELAVHVWPGPDCRGELYLDAGDGFGYRAGELRRVSYSCAPSPEGIEVTATSSGSYPAWWSATRLVVHGVPRRPSMASGATKLRYDPGRQVATATVPGAGADFSVTLRW